MSRSSLSGAGVAAFATMSNRSSLIQPGPLIWTSCTRYAHLIAVAKRTFAMIRLPGVASMSSRRLPSPESLLDLMDATSNACGASVWPKRTQTLMRTPKAARSISVLRWSLFRTIHDEHLDGHFPRFQLQPQLRLNRRSHDHRSV